MLSKTSAAQFRTEIAQYKEELDLSIINAEAETKGNRTNKFNETEYSKIKALIPSFNKKYENSLVIQEDKLVYKGNDKELYRKALEIGLIPEDELLDDEILEELQPFITEWTVEANDTITLPIGGTCDFTVNYGDGTDDYKVTSSTDEDRIHTYATAGTYTVTIKGKCTSFTTEFCNCKNKLTKIIQWGSTGFTNLNFHNCLNLSGIIPEPSKNSLKKISDMRVLFYNCKNLTGNIPGNLFKNCTEVARFSNVFNGCSNLTGSIPEELFKNNSKVNDFSSVFWGCSNLTGNIPEELFKNCDKVNNFSNLFNGCNNLTGNIPENLFKNCVLVKDFSQTFRDCKGLTGSIPEKLFENCTKVENFSTTFYGCKNLIGNIPENLFQNCAEVTSFNNVFSGCSNLTGSIPQELFENCNRVNNFSSAFWGCSKLTGNAPALWNRNNITINGSYCFKDCTNLSNYSDIPSNWK